jgi:hypothetical protein
MSTHIWMNENCSSYEVLSPDSSMYYGEMKDGKRHGYGLVLYKNGGNYEGYWKKGRKHGEGTRLYRNGDVYIGKFIKGHREGHGQYCMSGDSTYYNLVWKDCPCYRCARLEVQ